MQGARLSCKQNINAITLRRLTGSQRESGDVPQGRHDGGPHAVLANELFKLLPVLLLLLPHVLYERAFSCAAQHRHLTSVDTVRAQLARVVHANYLVQLIL